MRNSAMGTEFLDTKEKILFTPGPLTTSCEVKQAMLHDFGSRDDRFVQTVRSIRERLLLLGACSDTRYATVLIPGSGTYGVESVLSSVIGADDKLLILENGAYGKRLEMIAKTHGLSYAMLSFREDQETAASIVRERLAHEQFTHLAMIHCETTTGILNPIEEIGALAKGHGATFIVDAMSSFGGIPIDIPRCSIDFLISSSNKCIEGVPGFSFVIANIEDLLKSEGKARTLGLDLFAQYRGFEKDGQFRFTPPTHALAAFHRALDLLEREGGILARAKRYRDNHTALLANMLRMGFSCYVERDKQSAIICSFRFPNNALFNFERFYNQLKHRGFLIYPGKVSDADCFRIGTIGHIFPHDIENLTSAIERVMGEMAISLPLS